MNEYVIYLAPALGILGLIVMAIKSAWVSKQDAGDKKMQSLPLVFTINCLFLIPNKNITFKNF